MRNVFDAGRYIRWGSGGVGLALDISSFVGPCEMARADKRVLFGAHYQYFGQFFEMFWKNII